MIPVTWNLAAAWVGILVGLGGGALIGTRFREAAWLGGYGSWTRRLLRLGHISCFGLALLNLAFFGTAAVVNGGLWTDVASPLFIVGAVTMPLVCSVVAFRQTWHWLFVIPVLSLIIATTSVCLGTVMWISGGGA